MGQISVQGLTDAETGSGKKWISWSYLARVWLKELHEKTVGILLGGGGGGAGFILGNSNMQLCVLFLVLNFGNCN